MSPIKSTSCSAVVRRDGRDDDELKAKSTENYHRFQKEIGGIRGHFGPINALAFNPDGRSYDGGEDGYVRIHPLDNSCWI